MPDTRRIVITGAGRGLGLEFARRWLQAGDRVFALARKPEASQGLQALRKEYEGFLDLLPCDVGDDASVEAARERIAAAWDGLEILVNNAGTYGPQDQDLEEVDFDQVRRVFEVNTLGPMRVTRALLPLLRKGKGARIAHLTSLMGSIADNGSGGSWPYRISKTGLNMASVNMARQLRREGIPSVVLHPGWVRTEMGGEGAPLGIEESVGAMVRTIDGLTMERSGAFLDRNGEPVPW